MNLNRAIIVGRMTRDPELKAMPNGTSVASFSIATNSSYTDKQGVKHEKAEFHNVVVFGKMAETSAQYLKQGQEVLVEGKLSTRTWDKPNGDKGYKTEIIAERVQFGSRANSQEPRVVPINGKKPVEKPKFEGSIEYPEEDINPDDIPF